MTVFQLPSYSPHYNPTEFLKNMKRRATHNQYFPEVEDFVSSVDANLVYFANRPTDITNLMGLYLERFAALPAAA